MGSTGNNPGPATGPAAWREPGSKKRARHRRQPGEALDYELAFIMSPWPYE